jgi:cephalosporin-C deacetylase
MYKRFRFSFYSTLILIMLCCSNMIAYAQNEQEEGEVTFEAAPTKKDAIYDLGQLVVYKVHLKNTYKTIQEGQLSCLITNMANKKVGEQTVKVRLDKNSDGEYTLRLPNQVAGFYKANIMVNLTEYDDTIRRVFGVNPEQIRSKYQKPADFDQFWQTAKADLAKVKPQFRMTEMPDSSKDNRRVFLFEMQSLDDITIRGWLTMPNVKKKNKKFAVLLGLPGYQVGLKPMFGSDPDLAIITLNVRGQGNSKDVIHTERDDFIFHNLDDKNKYVFKGVIMDCVRSIDFIFSRPELDHDNIMVSGGSMGGYLAIATAALDNRVKLCSAQNPILCDIRNLPGKVDWPFRDINRFVNSRPGLTLDKVLGNLEYFDAKNFASKIKCSTLVGIGLLDHLAPPDNEYALYNNLQVDKHMIIFRDLGHEVAAEYKNYEGRWMRDTFGLF